MHLRAKRGNQTVFVRCESAERVEDIRKRLASIINRSHADIAIFTSIEDATRPVNATVLMPGAPDDATVGELGLQRDSILYFVLRDNQTDAWEKLALQELTVPRGN
jgi:hypothetical protein